MEEYLEDESVADNSDDEKRLSRADNRAGKKLINNMILFDLSYNNRVTTLSIGTSYKDQKEKKKKKQRFSDI